MPAKTTGYEYLPHACEHSLQSVALTMLNEPEAKHPMQRYHHACQTTSAYMI